MGHYWTPPPRPTDKPSKNPYTELLRLQVLLNILTALTIPFGYVYHTHFLLQWLVSLSTGYSLCTTVYIYGDYRQWKNGNHRLQILQAYSKCLENFNSLLRMLRNR